MEATDLHAVWQSQPSQLSPQKLERIRRNVRRFRRDRLLSLLGTPFLVVVALVFGAAAIFAEDVLISVGCGIFAASWAYTSVRICRIDWAGDATSDCIAHYRAYLVRRRDFYLRFHIWSGVPASVGVMIATLGGALAEPGRVFDVWMPAVFWVGLQLAFWVGHRERAVQLQRQIDALDAA